MRAVPMYCVAVESSNTDVVIAGAAVGR